MKKNVRGGAFFWGGVGGGHTAYLALDIEYL